MEIETTVDDFFNDIDSSNNGPSIHNEVDQNLISNPFMPSLSLAMNESSAFCGSEGLRFESMELPISSSGIFGNFNDGVVIDVS